MKSFKVFFITTLIFIIAITELSKADVLSGNKVAELNSQLVQEVKDALQIPLLRYESKNLSGNVKVRAIVNKSGKIIFQDLKGINENLTENVKVKLNSLNLWTSPDYTGKTFQYNINYKTK